MILKGCLKKETAFFFISDIKNPILKFNLILHRFLACPDRKLFISTQSTILQQFEVYLIVIL